MNRRTVLPILLLAGLSPLPAQTFDAASIKTLAPNDRKPGAVVGGPGTTDPERISYTGMAMITLLMSAYDLPSWWIESPSWMTAGSTRFDLEAKLPPGTTKEQFRTMLRNLFAERFHLQVHREIKQRNGYDLVIGKRGANVKETDFKDDPEHPAQMTILPPKDEKWFYILPVAAMLPSSERAANGGTVMKWTARAQPISRVVDILSSQLAAAVQDKTGLTGKYDFRFQYEPGLLDSRVEDGLSTLVDAVQDQLGLKLEAKKTMVEILIVDRADQTPSEN